jgi:arsenate reductase
MEFQKIVSVLLAVFAAAAFAGCSTNTANNPSSVPAPIVMVCEHGSVKSLMAASLFNQAAAERGLSFRAVARGVTPDASVPPAIVEAMRNDGFDVKSFVPVQLSDADISQSLSVVAIGVESAIMSRRTTASTETWSDVPAASVDYTAARASLKQHVDVLLKKLLQSQSQ